MIDDRTQLERRRDALHLQAIEGNPFDAEDTAMFAMFDRKRWNAEQRRAYIFEQARLKQAADKAS